MFLLYIVGACRKIRAHANKENASAVKGDMNTPETIREKARKLIDAASADLANLRREIDKDTPKGRALANRLSKCVIKLRVE